jgi:TatD DNase family protein
MIVDSHSHLDTFDDAELAGVLADARAAGVQRIVTVGMDTQTSARGAAIAASQDMVFAAVGLHPWLAQDHPQGAPLEELEALAAGDDVVAIGEIGLDFVDNSWLRLSYDDPALRAHQEEVFRAQLRLARRLGLPVILHSRGAHATTTRILGEEGMGSVGGCVQFFEGTPDDVAAYVALGFAFSVGASVTFPDAEPGWHETVRAVPTDALLLESDAPWQPYFGHDSGRSAPADLVAIGEVVAQVRGTDPAELFSATARNLRRVFPAAGLPG